jgi:hypothetical protein
MRINPLSSTLEGCIPALPFATLQVNISLLVKEMLLDRARECRRHEHLRNSRLILGAGLAMTLGAWGWSHAWIDLSLALLILLSIAGAAFNGTHAKRIAQQAAAFGEGPIPPDLRRQLNHPLHWTSVISMATMGLGIVFLMVEKPDWLGSVITLVIALLVGVILAQVLVRSGQLFISVQNEGLTEEQATRLSTRT